ncbi:MAG: Flp pilus assembly complex ATPase component TadA [Lachnospiraceae bacterium]|nr:Flp pilus assembly complex ATPase component TadA [Lachnospiraceae bacterium]
MNLFRKSKKQQKEYEKSLSFPELSKRILEQLYEYTEAGYEETAMTIGLRKSREEHRKHLSLCIRTCCSGSDGSKETVKELIYGICKKTFQERNDYLELLPFHEPENMQTWHRLEALIYYLDKQKKNQGFRILCEKFGWNTSGGTVSEENIAYAYQVLNPRFSEHEERQILVQILFAMTVGLGIIDTLNQQKGFIEEIQIGLSGKTNSDGIHIMAKGNLFRLCAISFENEEEKQRVLRNLIKDGKGGELTQNHPMMVVDTVDGRRVSVSRPPASDMWVGLIRKFDTVYDVSLEKMYQNSPESEDLPMLLRYLVRSGRNIAITGEMASGKTTLFRACLAEARTDLNIRVIESENFELNVREFLPYANSLTMRVTDQTPAEEVLAFARKTTGQIFAVGEITSAAVAVMTMDLSKIASQLFFSAHYISTEHMIADFVNAKLCEGGYSEEALAEYDVVRALGFDIHLKVREGRRYVQYINEIATSADGFQERDSSYEIRKIYVFDEDEGRGIILNSPGKDSYEKAKQLLGTEEYREFVRFFEKKVFENMSL